ncbi:ROK family transcriptional regulator [Paenibacillus qinlingensis]|uniref:NBD/HSP70 family sugar kinase n=1 Tax=Paenibacillus qinlingensis TaxID=1837343 RepID=A0ABU1NRH7_9BACL|nr:ROK family transcriptional regulator [Paenibacillus qinlingensis]MDR6550064.1 putative NBD/HSP70 family sugar kinase [Paenibacillus qinlingensis]
MTIRNKHVEQKSKLAILQALRMHGSSPRIRLATLTGLSRAAVSSAITELMESGLVIERELLQSTGGRPPIAIQLTPRTHAVIGADYEHQQWTLGAFDLIGHTMNMIQIPVGQSDPQSAIEMLTKQLPAFIKSIEAPIIPVLGLGMPGLIDTEHGIIVSASDLGWERVDIRKLIEDRIDWPTIVLNRHRARGLAECRFGSGSKNSHMIYVGVGTGIAAGLFHNQRLLSGALGGAGELMGHITIVPDGPLCPCGNQGCLQMLAAESAIEHEYATLNTDTYEDMTMDTICEAAELGDPIAFLAVTKAASYLGIALATMLNLFNPESIVLGGPIPRASRLYVTTAMKVMKERAMSQIVNGSDFRTAAIDEAGGALGAATFALDERLTYPMLIK